MADLEYSPALNGFVPLGTIPTATETVEPTSLDSLYVRVTCSFTLPDGIRGASLTIGGGLAGSASVVTLGPGSVFSPDILVATGGRLQLGPDLALADAGNQAVLTGNLVIAAGAAGVTITSGLFAGSVSAGGPIQVQGFATFVSPLDFLTTPQLTSLPGSQTLYTAALATPALRSVLANPGFAGTFTFAGTLDNTAATLDLSGTSSLVFSTATITGGTLLVDPSDVLTGTTLDGVTLSGTLNTVFGDYNVATGSLSGGTLTIDGAFAFGDTTTLDNIDITLGSSALLDGTRASETVFGAGATIHVSDTAMFAFAGVGAHLRIDGTLDLSASVSPYTVDIEADLGAVTFGANAEISVGANATLKINGALFNSGTIPVIGGTLELAQGGGSLGTLRFAGSDAALRLDAIGQSVTLLDFQDGDHLVFPAASTSNAHVVLNGNTVDVFSGSNKLAGHFVLNRSDGGAYSAQNFVFNTSGASLALATNGVAITACYAAGTRIETETGEQPIETLAAGDRVRTLDGTLAPVKWIGHRTIDLRHHPRPHDVQPVRVAAHTFGPGLPKRDLILSPDHAVFVEGVLVPIRYLVNGATIAQQAADHVTYLHLELAAHGVVLAEGLPAETYLDTGNRGAFANGGPAMQLHPDFALRLWQSGAFAPLVTSGETIALIRHTLHAQAAMLGHRRTTDPGYRLLPVKGGFRLASRVSVPAHMDPASDDHRQLGIAVTRLTADGTNIPLDDVRLAAGWHAPEPGLRWTAGAAFIALPAATHLAVEYRAPSATYWLARQPDATPQRQGATAA